MYLVIFLLFDLEKICSIYVSEMKKLKLKLEVFDNDYNILVKYLLLKLFFSLVIVFDYFVEKILIFVYI